MKNLTRNDHVTARENEMRIELKFLKQDQERFEKSLVRAAKAGMDLQDFANRVKEQNDEIEKVQAQMTELGYDENDHIAQY